MYFEHSPEQDEFRASLRRFLADKAPLPRLRSAVETELGYDPALWRQMSDQLGLPGLHLPEEHGGADTGLVEPAIVLEETGRALTSSPYAASLLASLAVLRLGSPEAQRSLLPGLASGRSVGTLAVHEPVGGRGATEPRTTASPRGDQLILTGTKTLVEHGHSADVLLVSAVRTDTPAGEVGLYIVRGDAPGLSRSRQDALDLTRPVAEVRLDATPAAPLGEHVPGALDDLADLACVLLSAEMVGGTEACMAMAVAYAKDRRQFNRPIGSFQAVKHRCAEMLVALDGARATAWYAVLVAGQNSPEMGTVAPLAKAETSEAFTFAAGGTIQILGGIGFTWEQDAHLYFRRAWADTALWGNPAAQRARLADRIGL